MPPDVLPGPAHGGANAQGARPRGL
jgi:hypothetical protein